MSIRILWFLLPFLWWLSAQAGNTLQTTDDLGEVIRLKAPAQRVISLAPHITETVFAIGAGKQLVGVVDYSNYPESALKIQKVGSYKKLDIEAIVALQPDLIIAWHSGNPPEQIESLRRLGFPVYITEPRRLRDIPDGMRRLGVLLGQTQHARQLAEALEQGDQAIRQQYQQRAPVRVFYQIWPEPLMTLNGQHIFSDLLQSCGGQNVFAELPSLAARISAEAVLERDPDMILVSGMGASSDQGLELWRQWPNLQAVAQGNLYFIHPDLVQRSGPRLFEGQRQLCQMIDEVRNKRGQHDN